MRDEAKTNTQEDETDTNIGGKTSYFPLSTTVCTFIERGFRSLCGKTPAAIVAMAKAGNSCVLHG